MSRPFSSSRFHLGMGGLTLLIIGSMVAVLVLVLLPGQRKSDATQHGTRAVATVVMVTQRSGRDSSTDITVKLTLPSALAGKTSTVNVHGLKSYGTGTTLTVMVDNTDTGYAELPGQPMMTSTSVQEMGVLIVALAIFLVGAWAYLAHRAGRRARLGADRPLAQPRRATR